MNESSRSEARHRLEDDRGATVVEDTEAVVVVAGADLGVVGAAGAELAEGVLLAELPQAASRSAAENASRVAFTPSLSPIRR
jgi:hypothetical protein